MCQQTTGTSDACSIVLYTTSACLWGVLSVVATEVVGGVLSVVATEVVGGVLSVVATEVVVSVYSEQLSFAVEPCPAD